MANRYFNQFTKTLEKELVMLFAHVTFAGSGASTLDTANSKGIVSITHDSTGLYTFVFGTSAAMLDVYYKFLGCQVVFLASGSPAAPLYSVVANNVSTVGTCSLQLRFTDKAQAGVADPGSGEEAYFIFYLKNSSAP